MRRKRTASGGGSALPADLRVERAPVFVDDLHKTVGDRCAAYDEWAASYTQWQEGRRAWASLHGWPGGETAMESEEPDWPDAPFDPASI